VSSRRAADRPAVSRGAGARMPGTLTAGHDS
jgi:hypothetical protein